MWTGIIVAVLLIWTVSGFTVDSAEKNRFTWWEELRMFPMLLLLWVIFWAAQQWDRMRGLTNHGEDQY
jgi:hypothetical protein